VRNNLFFLLRSHDESLSDTHALTSLEFLMFDFIVQAPFRNNTSQYICKWKTALTFVPKWYRVELLWASDKCFILILYLGQAKIDYRSEFHGISK
jgi:hypothetical protein